MLVSWENLSEQKGLTMGDPRFDEGYDEGVADYEAGAEYAPSSSDLVFRRGYHQGYYYARLAS